MIPPPAFPRFARFRPPGDPEGTPWLVLEVKGRWLLFLHATAEHRRLSPVPPDWDQLGPADLAAFLARATPAPSPPFTPPAEVRPPERSGAPAPNTESELRELLLWERERRLAAEAMLLAVSTELQQLKQEVESANAELQTFNDELQAMTAADKASILERI